MHYTTTGSDVRFFRFENKLTDTVTIVLSYCSCCLLSVYWIKCTVHDDAIHLTTM